MPDLLTRVDEGEQFTPPYIHIGLYERERRVLIESQNRKTIAAIFERRGRERAEGTRREIAYANHLIGVHTYGFCEWCGPRYLYD
jgi:hypothetical protein